MDDLYLGSHDPLKRDYHSHPLDLVVSPLGYQRMYGRVSQRILEENIRRLLETLKPVKPPSGPKRKLYEELEERLPDQKPEE